MAQGRLGFRKTAPARGRPNRTCTAWPRAFQAVRTQMINGLTRSPERPPWTRRLHQEQHDRAAIF